MKLKNILPVTSLALAFGLNACYNEKMEWSDPYNHPETKELPLELQEKISRYDALNTYTTAKLGVGVDFNLYTTDATYRDLVNRNFDEITPGNELKQSSLMKDDGTLDFSKADAVIAELKSAGLTVYGHTLVWHSQQKAGYLNSLIAPTIIPGTPGSSLIANGDFENGLDGWSIPYYAEVVTAGADGGAIDGTHSMRVAVGDFGGGKYSMQINSPAFPIINGHRYEISFYIKSEGEGQVGLDFPNNNLANQYPWTSGNELTATSSAWTKVIYNPATTPDGMVATADNNAMTFRLLLGAVKNMTYYIDAVEVIDLDASTEYNYVTDGGFEKGELPEGWSAMNPGAGVSVTDEDKFTGDYSVKMTSNASAKNAWDLQLQSAVVSLDKAKSYTFSFYVKSNTAGKGRVSFPGNMNGNQYPWLDWTGAGAGEAFTTAAGQWTLISVPITNTGDVQLSFDMGYLPDVIYYIDDVKIVEQKAESSPLRSGPVTIEKTPEEKAQILESVLQKYIADVAAHYKGIVSAWDVVNEPMNDNGTLRPGEENLKSTDAFYWQYYLGKEYAVKAFKWAEEADKNVKLFINDYGLESAGGAKLDGLIEYVKYIEQNGGKVDGIGTQMHLNINWSDTTAIEKMFQKLASTGKLIKISELDVAIAGSSNPDSPVSPTAEQYARQAELYRFVANAYHKHIPENQRYGITVWGVSDNENEHQYWLKNDAPCLWNADYARKHAYKGFADGLAGQDVSADFSGELVY
ncbi:MAG: endo-1,4-beta-xylanase [Dysgonamonadaceae bacterium]|jgi:GH35 family endo-1,4-beta-xylanase|nr:endo-1,4-beta-xylanase [Dysgonamonadaceae bacterium]